MTDIYLGTGMYGGYVKDSLLRTNESGLRTFTQVMDDGSTRGSFSYRDRRDPKMKAYRTPWMPIAHKIFTEKCNAMKDKTGKEECPPMIIKVRETTLGNNKYNLGKRQRQYYVTQEFYDEPRKIGNIMYTYEPRSWFMKWDETPEAFFARMYSKRDAKRRHLPPIPDIYKDKVELKIKVIPPKKGRGAVTISDDVPITAPPPKKGRVKRTTRKEMEEAKKTRIRAERPGLEFLEAEGEEIPEERGKAAAVPTPGGRKAPSPVKKISTRTPKTVPTRREPGVRPLTPRTAPAKVSRVAVTPGKVSKKTPISPAKTPEEEGRETLILTLDGNPFDTRIPTDLPDVEILNQILLEEEPGDAEIIATILNMARDQIGWDYSDVIKEDENLLMIDPERKTINGITMIKIIDALKQDDESIVDFLRSLNVQSYAGPGTFTILPEEGSQAPSEEGGLEGLEGLQETEGSEGSEESEGTSRFAGEAGQEYLDRYLSSLRR